MTWAFCSLRTLLTNGRAAGAMPSVAVAAWVGRPWAWARWAALHFLGNRQMGGFGGGQRGAAAPLNNSPFSSDSSARAGQR